MEPFSVLALGAFIWAMCFLLPKAVKQHEALAIGAAILTAALALITWLLIGIRLTSR
jgi:hypothetical protein